MAAACGPGKNQYQVTYPNGCMGATLAGQTYCLDATTAAKWKSQGTDDNGCSIGSITLLPNDWNYSSGGANNAVVPGSTYYSTSPLDGTPFMTVVFLGQPLWTWLVIAGIVIVFLVLLGALAK